MVRAFLAINLPQELKKKLSNLTQISIPEDIKVKWVEEENFHITLKFFGNIKISLLEKLCRETELLTQNFPSFNISLNKLGFFSQKKSPRVVWIGVATENNLLFELYNILKKIFKKFKLEEEKDFHPHITLFRVKEVKNIKNFNSYFESLDKEVKSIEGYTFKVNELTFFESILSSTGPTYKSLYQVKLK